MSNEALKVFAYFGVMCAAGCMGLILWGLSEWIREKMRAFRYAYRVRHRFGRKPVAKCYCKDCEDWNREKERCMPFDKYCPDNGFCHLASPRPRRD